MLCYSNSIIGSCNYDSTISENGAIISPKTPGSGGYNIIGYDSYQIIDRICMPSVNTFSYLTKSGIQAVNSFQSLLQQGYLMNFVTDVKNVKKYLFRIGESFLLQLQLQALCRLL